MMSSTSSSQLINRGNWEQERTLKDESGNPCGYVLEIPLVRDFQYVCLTVQN